MGFEEFRFEKTENMKYFEFQNSILLYINLINFILIIIEYIYPYNSFFNRSYLKMKNIYIIKSIDKDSLIQSNNFTKLIKKYLFRIKFIIFLLFIIIYQLIFNIFYQVSLFTILFYNNFSLYVQFDFESIFIIRC